MRRSEYLYRLSDGQHLYVSSDAGEPAYGTFRLFLGRLPTLSEVAITEVQRLRDGGTTYITTPAGQFFCPSVFRKDLAPTWNGDVVERLNPAVYRFEEAAEHVTIRPHS